MREKDGVRLDVPVYDTMRVEEGQGLETGLAHRGDLNLIHSREGGEKIRVSLLQLYINT